jgi:hypothetical protein
MDTQVLAEEFITNCLAAATADEGTHEVAAELEDGRALIVAACPPGASAAFAVELNLRGIDKDTDGEVELGLLEAVWNHRLGEGYVLARESSGKDFVALVAHRSTAVGPALAASMARLLAVAADPVAPVESHGEQVPSTGWMAV